MSDFDRWIAGQGVFRVLDVNYADVVAEPSGSCRAVSAFLDNIPDPVAMAATVDPLLYRNRK